MLIAKNLRSLRLSSNMTQEELAERLGVTGQAVSKWERDECYPDITLLPGLANCFGVTVDELIGMSEISDSAKLWDVAARAAELEEQKKYTEAADVYGTALRIFPSDTGLLAARATALAMTGEDIENAIAMNERLLQGEVSDKRRGTTVAVLCFLYCRAGMPDKAEKLARLRPHAWESRELLLPYFLEKSEREAYLRKYLPYILATVCALIDDGVETDEGNMHRILRAAYDNQIPSADAARKIAEFLG